MSRLKIILNPYAHRWQARERIPEIRTLLDGLGADYDLVESEAPGHAVELAAEAARDGYELVVAAGGDGTIHEVLNGLLPQTADEERLPRLGILPVGTANDLAWSLGIPADLRQASIALLSGETRPLDVGECNGRYFLNNVGIGLEPYVTHLQAQMKGSGTWRYLGAALKGITRNPRWEMDVRWEAGRYRGPVTLVSIGNGARTGGFYLTPEADPSDGQLDVIFGFLPTRFQAVRHLAKAMRPHNNLAESRFACLVRTRSLAVQCNEAVYLHTDGELQPRVSEITIRLHPARLSLAFG